MPPLARTAVRSSLLPAHRRAPRLRAMASVTPPAVQPGSGGTTEVKILMLHGYTQSGALFRAKTRALEKLLAKTLAAAALVPVLLYPTAPNRLLPRDMPGYQPPAAAAAAADPDDPDDPDAWAWFSKDDASGAYRLFDRGAAALAAGIRDAAGIDAVCGFSQGAALAALVAAALEPARAPPDGQPGDWARQLRAANAGRPLRFAVAYLGFFAPVDAFEWCYRPAIATPTLHYLGSLDTVIDEGRSQGLIDRCDNPTVVVHPGGHHVPVAKEWVMPLAVFVKQHAQPAARPTAEL